jgi:hypothetical protein
MLFAVATVSTIVGLSDAARPVILIVFILLLFGIAGIALFFGKRHIEAQQARALSNDTGVMKGAMKGADTTFDAEWLAATRAEDDDDRPRQSWKDAILGPGALHDDTPDTTGEVLAPEIRLQRESASAAQDAAWNAPDEDDQWVGGGAAAWTANPVENDTPAELPAYLQPEDVGPVPPMTPAPKHALTKPASAPFLVDSGLDDDED